MPILPIPYTAPTTLSGYSTCAGPTATRAWVIMFPCLPKRAATSRCPEWAPLKTCSPRRWCGTLPGIWMRRSSRFWLLSGQMNSNSISISAAAWTTALTTSACISSICCRRRYYERTLNAGMANGICAASGRLPAVIFRLAIRNLRCRQRLPISWGTGSEPESAPFRALILPSCMTLPTPNRLPTSGRCRNLQRPPGNWE